MTPKQVLEVWIEAFNAKDVGKLVSLYHPNAVNHQVANAPVEGQDAIEEMFVQEFEKTERVCVPENSFADGEWAIVEWKDPQGLRGCDFFQVIDGLIQLQRGYWDKLSFMRLHHLTH